MVEVEVRHRQGARYQCDVRVPKVVITTAAAAGMEVRIGLSREGQAVQVYTVGHWEGQPEIQWTAEPTWREPLHSEGQVGRGRADGEIAAEQGRAEQENKKCRKEAAAEGLDMLGDGRDREDMLQKWAQRLRGKATAWQNVLRDNGDAQLGLGQRIKGCRGEEVRKAVTKARYHLKARAEAVGDKCRPECTLARCLCRLVGPQEPKGGYHGIRLRQPRRQGSMWLQMGEDDGAPLVCFHQVKHMWVGYADGRSGTVGEDESAAERQAKAQVLTSRKVEPKQAPLWMQMQRDAQVAASVDSTSRTSEVWGPTRQVLALALYVGDTVRCSRGMAREWDPDTEMHRMRKVMAMVEYDGAAVGRAKGHTIQVVSPQASATGAADQGVTDLVQDGHTWWVVEPRGDRRHRWCLRRHRCNEWNTHSCGGSGRWKRCGLRERRRSTRRLSYRRWKRKWIDVRRQRKWRTSGNRSGGSGVGGQRQGRGAAEVDSAARHGRVAQEGGIGESEKARGGGTEAVPGAGG